MLKQISQKSRILDKIRSFDVHQYIIVTDQARSTLPDLSAFVET
ncbi:hypothetical protein NBRC111894_33 [Sporolactobacillus inulinus]|uniref:Uncharacterized protein n=1 Tax=Sporolactobacillus inulinus TaxID=2078 RepID=A0A4Y1Z695_9BACL|nr:hypothetical protein NBRC111894_33 [Sporolactobacillus inulinus]